MSSFSLISNRSSYQDGGRSDGGVSNLTVALRIRPLNAREKKKGATQVIYKVDERMVVMMDPGQKLNNFLGAKRSKEKKFLFDFAFGPESTQEEVFSATSLDLVDSVLDGYNATVFAYGATGAGKTHTMLGTSSEPGIMAQALGDLFVRLDEREEDKFSITMSYLEIYNETIRDLLVPRSKVLDLREDSKGGVHVAGLSELSAATSDEVLKLLREGNERRTQEPTDANQTSSRSHAVLQVNLVKRSKAGGIKSTVGHSKLFMIDLAGSERAANTKNEGKRLKEGAHINRSLLALGNVINGLTEKNLKYVNYRDSKLTRLLKDSLGGNSRTTMIAHVSPSSLSFEESRTTLTYADRAKNITTKMSKTTEDVTQHVSQYQSIISELRREIARLKGRIDEQNLSGLSPAAAPQRSPSELSVRKSQSRRGSSARRQRSDLGGSPVSSSGSGSSSSAKEALVANFAGQMRLRERLMEHNLAAFDAAAELSSKGAILQAWDEKNNPDFVSSTYDPKGPPNQPDSIKVLRGDIVALEGDVAEAEAKRSDIEWDLAVAVKKAEKSQESVPSSNEVLQLLTRLHEAEVEKKALQSDSILLNRRLERQESSLQKVTKYHGVVSQLVGRQQRLIEEASLPQGKEEVELLGQYRTTKSQAHYHLLPLNNKAEALSSRSWNRAVMEQERERSSSARLSKTLNSSELQKIKSSAELRDGPGSADSVHLPPISGEPRGLESIRAKARRRRDSLPDERRGRRNEGGGRTRSNSSSGRRPQPKGPKREPTRIPRRDDQRKDSNRRVRGSPIQYLPVIR